MIEKSAYSELLSVFTAAFRRFWLDLKLFLSTSLGILTLKPVYEAALQKDPAYLRDTRYAYLVFEYILIFVIFTRLVSVDSGTDEGEELIQEFVVLLLFFVGTVIALLLGSTSHLLVYKGLSKREVQAHFIYAYCLPFLPVYLITHLSYGYFLDDEDAFNGILILLLLASIIFFVIYFYRVGKGGRKNGIQAFVSAWFPAILLGLLLFISIAAITGAAYGENA
ncbi:MAG: hypothetical protein AAF616_14085 [Bacteroidota bacterium]